MKKLFILLLTLGIFFRNSLCADIQILNPHVSPAPFKGNAVLYLKIANSSLTPDKLLNITAVEAPHMASLNHLTVITNNETSTPTFLLIPAKGNVDLLSGSRHLLITDVNRALFENEAITVTFIFQNNEPISLKVPVRSH